MATPPAVLDLLTAGDRPNDKLPAGLMFKLSVMMFLQFFIWGAWFELGFAYIPSLDFPEKWMNPLMFGAFNIGALVALFFSTQFADRNYAAEKFLSFSHLIGGLAIGGIFFLHPLEGEKAGFWPFFGLMLLHSIFYVPTVSITNSIAFNAFTNPEKQFGPVRLWGTFGWIVASWPFIFLLIDWAAAGQKPANGLMEQIGNALGTDLKGRAAMDMQRYIFLVAGIASLLLSAFSLTLPHTPPKPAKAGEDSLAWLKAFKLLKNPLIAVLFVVTFIDAAVHQTFFILTPGFLGTPVDQGGVGINTNWIAPVMKIGQIAEIFTMLALGWVLKTLGWRTTMIIGVLGHAARFAVFAFYPQEVPSIAVNAIHGICYAFFFATVYIYVDKKFPKDIRSSAQGLFNVLILGVGPFIGGFLINEVIAANSIDKQVLYSKVFLYPMGAALLGAVLLALFFHPKDMPTDAAD